MNTVLELVLAFVISGAICSRKEKELLDILTIALILVALKHVGC